MILTLAKLSRMEQPAYLAQFVLMTMALLETAIARDINRNCNVNEISPANCLSSCKQPCQTERCLTKCHYDTLQKVLQLTVSPPEGPSFANFNETVKELTLYLDENVTLRIDPIGLYKGTTEVADYIATFVHPYGLGSVDSIDRIDMVSFANTGHVAAATAILKFFKRSDPTRRLTNLTLMTWSSFDPITNKILLTDWSFLRLVPYEIELNKPDARVSDEAAANMVQQICETDQKFCWPAGYGQYANYTACEAFVTSLPRFAPYGLQGNNMFCRFMHTAYATVDQKVHCPHIGLTGGGACVEQAYEDYYKVFPDLAFLGQR